MTEPAGPPWCPRCLREVGEAARCPACGLPQLGADAARLRVVVRRLSDIAEQQRALGEEANSLRSEQWRLLQALSAQGGWAAPRAGREWRPEMVRGVLLWVGSALVALAALIFAVVAWIRLGDVGRAGLLAGVTLLAALGTLAAARWRLPATAGARDRRRAERLANHPGLPRRTPWGGPGALPTPPPAGLLCPDGLTGHPRL